MLYLLACLAMIIGICSMLTDEDTRRVVFKLLKWTGLTAGIITACILVVALAPRWPH